MDIGKDTLEKKEEEQVALLEQMGLIKKRIERLWPQSMEKQRAITKLEEAVCWLKLSRK